jgi:S-formylglutathione hydrolase FrmB
VIGDWESFIAKDVVAYVDKHYRTIAKRGGRGLAGHSMGGYGTLRIGMKYPQVFGALYAMSSAVMLRAPDAAATKAQLARLSDTGLKSVPRNSDNGIEAQASAWAPNPQAPPWFFDLPYDAAGNENRLIVAKWAANSPLVTAAQNVPALKSFRAIQLDVGNADGLAESNTLFSEELKRLGVEHGFTVYDGNHGNRIGARFIADVLPFFAKHLAKK